MCIYWYINYILSSFTNILNAVGFSSVENFGRRKLFFVGVAEADCGGGVVRCERGS